MEWQQIKTAPKDGTRFLAAWKGGDMGYEFGVIWWEAGSWFEHSLDDPVGDPDCWMPLPSSPSLSES